ncbi:MAG: hypothetical protein ACFFB5_05260 [Promethearchaeota archaeon]
MSIKLSKKHQIVVAAIFSLFLLTLVLILIPFSSHPLIYKAPSSPSYYNGVPGVNGAAPFRDTTFNLSLESITERLIFIRQRGVRTVTHFDAEIELAGPERVFLPIGNQPSYVQSHDLVIEQIKAYEPLVLHKSHLDYIHVFQKNPCLVRFTRSLSLSPNSSPANLRGKITPVFQDDWGFTETVSDGNNKTIYFSTTYLFVHGSVTYFNGETRYYEVVSLQDIDFGNIYPVENINDETMHLNTPKYVMDSNNEPIEFYNLMNRSLSGTGSITVELTIPDDKISTNSFLFNLNIELERIHPDNPLPIFHGFYGTVESCFRLRFDNYLSLNIELV